VTVYEFQEQLQWSEGVVATEDDLLRVLRSRIPGCIERERAAASDDRQGTDYWAHRRHGLRPLSIDLKARSEDPIETRGADDVALETWSVTEHQKVGWTRDETKQTDYILWMWQPTKRFLLVPFPALCKCFQHYWQAWAKEYKCYTQDSGGWHSECVFVPRAVLLDKLTDWMNGAAA
jgi:hypothetical protein